MNTEAPTIEHQFSHDLWSSENLCLDLTEDYEKKIFELLHRRLKRLTRKNMDFPRYPNDSRSAKSAYIDYLRNAVAGKSKTKTILCDELNLFVRGLAAVEPSFANTHFRPPPAQQHLWPRDITVRYPRARSLYESAIEHLGADSSSGLTNLESIGRLIFFLIYRVGVIDRQCLAAVCANFNQPVRVSPTWNWVEVDYPASSGAGMIHRRVLLDAATTVAWASLNTAAVQSWLDCRIESAAQRKPVNIQQQIWPALRAYLALLAKFNGAEPSSSFKQLLDDAKAIWVTKLPPLLFGFATGDIVATSLPEHVWFRINGWPGAAEDEKNLKVRKHFRNEPPSGSDFLQGAESIGNELAHLRKAIKLKNGSHRTALHQLADAILTASTDWSYIEWLIKFFAHFAIVGGTSGKKPEAGTLRTSLGTLGHRFEIAFRGQAIGRIGPTARAACYEELLEDAPSAGTATRLRDLLREFDAFVMLMLEEPGKPWSMSVSFDESGLIASANVISFNECHQLIQQLKGDGSPFPDKERQVISELVVALGFRGGMRKSEIHGLRAQDHHGDRLLNRPNKFRGLKTKNARRTIPLTVLDSPQANKLKRLTDLAHKNNDEYIFQTKTSDVGSAESEPIKEHNLFPYIKRMLVEVTADPGVHFHHLRHSCATWYSVVALAPEIKLWRYKNQSSLVKELAGFAKSKFDPIINGSPRTSGRIYSLAHLLGHGSAATTLHHYVHLLDLCLFSATQIEMEATLLRDLAAISGRSLSSKPTRTRKKPKDNKKATKPKSTQTVLKGHLRGSDETRFNLIAFKKRKIGPGSPVTDVSLQRLKLAWSRTLDDPCVPGVKGNRSPGKLKIRPPNPGFEQQEAIELMKTLNAARRKTVVLAELLTIFEPAIKGFLADRNTSRISPAQAESINRLLTKTASGGYKLRLAQGKHGDANPTRGKNAQKPRDYRLTKEKSTKDGGTPRSKAAPALAWVFILTYLTWLGEK